MTVRFSPEVLLYAFELVAASIIVLIVLRLRNSRKSWKRTNIRPPCEEVLLQAESTNKCNGHENQGYLSRKAAFAPLLAPAQALPPSHAAWDHLASRLPSLIQSQTLRVTIDQMPLLSAETERDLADYYLHRAASVLGIIAHAYVRLEGSTSLTIKYSDHSKILPRCLYVPWTQVCRRLGRPDACLSYIDLVISNFKTTSSSYEDVTLENSGLLVATVNNQEERTFYGTMIEINSKVIPILQHIIEAQRAVVANDISLLRVSLISIVPLLQEVARTLHKITPNRTSKSYVDPVIWTKTVASLAVPWLDVTGAAGTAHPFFHLMDEFTGRSKYNSRIGKEAQHIRSTFPPHWRQFLHAIGQISVKDYIEKLGDESCKEFTRLWTTVEEVYSGHNGLLGVHRRKVYGYLAVSFRFGRDSTINGLGRRLRSEPWKEADNELEKARVERRQHLPAAQNHTSTPSHIFHTLTTSEVLQHTSEDQGYWFTIGRDVYDATSFMGSHPGGATIIALCSGQDATSDLETVAHLSEPRIKAILNKYRRGILRKPQLEDESINDFYEVLSLLGKTIAETENVSKAILSMLFSKLTSVDKPEQMTPQKMKHLLDHRDQLQTKHAPALATLLNFALQKFAALSSKTERAKTRAGVAEITLDEGNPSHFPSIQDKGRWSSNADLLKQDISRLAKMKRLTITILRDIEQLDDGTRCLSKVSIGDIADLMATVRETMAFLVHSESDPRRIES